MKLSKDYADFVEVTMKAGRAVNALKAMKKPKPPVKQRRPFIRYRAPSSQGSPLPGHIIMGSGPRVRRAYRVLSVKRGKGMSALGSVVWHVAVEPISAAAGRSEIEGGCCHWGITWDSRRKGAQRKSVHAG